jgi:hypothetical protein
MDIDSNFPTGNIVLEGIEGDDVYIKPDLRDTQGHWFYWCFRVRGVSGRKIRFHLTSENTLTDLGAAASLDDGWTWKWIGVENVSGQTFEYRFPKNADDVRFSMGMPYSERNLQKFLQKYRNNQYLETGFLCKSRKGGAVEKMLIGNPVADCEFRILITARHHCCEMMASYALEGIVESVLEDSPISEWFMENAQLAVIPFVDKDGVEDGDQGKNRKPHDHNRDYIPDAVYNETKAIMDFVPGWITGKTFIALDLHCPWIRGDGNNMIFIPGSCYAENLEEQKIFSEILEETNKGELPYFAEDDLPFGKGWNTGMNPGEKSSVTWAYEAGARLALTLEIPYSLACGKEVNQRSAKVFGNYLAAAVRTYLENIHLTNKVQ